MSCDNCIKKDICKISEKYNKAKEMIEDTLLNIEDEDVINSIEMNISCIHFDRNFMLRKTQEEKHIPSLY